MPWGWAGCGHALGVILTAGVLMVDGYYVPDFRGVVTPLVSLDNPFFVYQIMPAKSRSDGDRWLPAGTTYCVGVSGTQSLRAACDNG